MFCLCVVLFCLFVCLFVLPSVIKVIDIYFSLFGTGDHHFHASVGLFPCPDWLMLYYWPGWSFLQRAFSVCWKKALSPNMASKLVSPAKPFHLPLPPVLSSSWMWIVCRAQHFVSPVVQVYGDRGDFIWMLLQIKFWLNNPSLRTELNFNLSSSSPPPPCLSTAVGSCGRRS